MDPVEKRRRCREYAEQVRRHPAPGVPAAGRVRRLGQPVPHDGARLPGGDRARVRALRRPRHRLQGPEARALVHALQDGAGPGRGGVRGAAHAVGVREVPARRRAAGAGRRARRASGASPSSGRPRRGRCRPTSPSPCIPTQSYTALDVGGDVHVVATRAARGLSAPARRARRPAGTAARRSRLRGSDLVGAVYKHPWIERERPDRRRRVRRDGRGHRPRAHRARPRRGGLRPRPRARPADLQPGGRRRTLHRRGRALRRVRRCGRRIRRSSSS